MEISGIGLATAFAEGAIWFLSPCVLPVVPAYVSYIGGESLQSGQASLRRSRISAAALSGFFIRGAIRLVRSCLVLPSDLVGPQSYARKLWMR